MEANEAHRKRRIALAVTTAGGQVTYLHQEVGTGDEMLLDFNAEPPGPRWLRDLVGPDYFQEPRRIGISSGKVTDKWLIRHIDDISRLKKLNTLSLDNSKLSSETVGCLGRLTRLDTLMLWGPTGDEVLPEFHRLTNLRVFLVIGRAITDKGLAYLCRFQRLEDLTLVETSITDGGLQNLSRLPNLKRLYIEKARITDSGLRHLESLSDLEVITLRDTQATESGVERLRNSLPTCEILFFY